MSEVPDGCTLPTAEQPLRVARFEELFATALRGLDRSAPTRLRLTLDGAAEVEARARELAALEGECCAFFAFTFGRGDDGRLHLHVEVPVTRTDVLDALAAWAQGASGLGLECVRSLG